MDQMRWKLRDFLRQRHIPTLKLEREAGISRVTLYRITSPNKENQQLRVDLPTLAAIIGALRNITGEDVSPNDVLEYTSVPDPEPLDDESRAWLESDLGGLGRFEPYEWQEGELEGGTPLRYVAGKGWIV